MELVDLWRQRATILDKIDILNAENGLLPGMQILHVPLNLERFASLPRKYWELELERLRVEAQIVLRNWQDEVLAPEGRVVFSKTPQVAMMDILNQYKMIYRIIQK